MDFRVPKLRTVKVWNPSFLAFGAFCKICKGEFCLMGWMGEDWIRTHKQLGRLFLSIIYFTVSSLVSIPRGFVLM